MTYRNILTTLAVAGTTALLFAAPLAAQQQTGSICKDGTTDATVGRGACGHHGGVDKAAMKATKTAAKTDKVAAKGDTKADKAKPDMKTSKASTKPAGAATAPASAPNAAAATHTPAKSAASASDDKNPAGAIAKCKDGMYSHSTHRAGACGHHGGVAQWMGQ